MLDHLDFEWLSPRTFFSHRRVSLSRLVSRLAASRNLTENHSRYNLRSQQWRARNLAFLVLLVYLDVAMISSVTLKKIRDIVGKSNFLDSIEDRISYSYDGTPMLQQLPDGAVIPQSVEQVVEILKLANQERFAVVPRGSGSGLSGGSLPVRDSIVLLMNHWNRIIEIDEQNFTAWVEPGVITGNLHAAVESRNLFYPPDPGSSSICTIGGNVAENAGGLLGLKYGVTKNYVMGLEVVLPTGEFLRAGGKVVKDVAGYDLKDYFVGSEGTLGIFTRILLRLIPKPETSRTLVAFFASLSDSGNAVADIVASRVTPAALEFLDNATIRSVEAYASLGLPTSAASMLLIELDGRKSVVEEDVATVTSILQLRNAAEIKVAQNETEATKLKTARKAAFSALARLRPTAILEDATVPRSEVPKMLEIISQCAQKYGLLIGNFGHAGDGNLHPTCLIDERNSAEVQSAHACFSEIFDAAVRLGGTITGEHGVGLAKREFFERLANPAALEMMKKIKLTLDPNQVLNPGKVLSLRPRCEGPLPATKERLQAMLATGAFI